MSARGEPSPVDVARFRVRLVIALMAIVAGLTALVLYATERAMATAVETELRRAFQADLAGLRAVHELRHAALVERCRALVRRPRIHAALEDNALDLLYPSARDELGDLMADTSATPPEYARYALHAEFYRFLDRSGAVIPPSNDRDVGALRPEEQNRLSLPALPDHQQLGLLAVRDDALPDPRVLEVIAMPVVSGESGDVIAALVLGFSAPQLDTSTTEGPLRGWWTAHTLDVPGIKPTDRLLVASELERTLASRNPAETVNVEIAGTPHLLFFHRVNPGSVYPAAYEVSLYSLAELRRRQASVRRSALIGAGLLLLVGFGASGVIATRLARPVEQLAVDSAENRAQRQRAEAALEMTHEELQRAARFSADASHQLKTPLTVLRAGLEELLTRDHLSPEECQEIAVLIQQTHRLAGVVDDLLLLSRMDAGRLKIDFRPTDLTALVDAALDDLSALSDETDLTVETNVPGGIYVEGERRYLSVILQNLLENARKYNRPGGHVQVDVDSDPTTVRLRVRNTGTPIPAAAQGHIFERFHRGAMGENVPGNGLGLNLARELARLHRGDLRLVRSDDEWTEFEATFCRATAPVARVAT